MQSIFTWSNRSNNYDLTVVRARFFEIIAADASKERRSFRTVSLGRCSILPSGGWGWISRFSSRLSSGTWRPSHEAICYSSSKFHPRKIVFIRAKGRMESRIFHERIKGFGKFESLDQICRSSLANSSPETGVLVVIFHDRFHVNWTSFCRAREARWLWFLYV